MRGDSTKFCMGGQGHSMGHRYGATSDKKWFMHKFEALLNNDKHKYDEYEQSTFLFRGTNDCHLYI